MPNYYLFRSSNTTYRECINRMLVGQKEKNKNQVLEIKPNDIVFIHKTGNYLPVQEQFIEGPYFAVSNGQMNIVEEAWNADFPYQVRIEKRGMIARISQETFSKFSLRYSVGKAFIQFKLPDFVGKKLMNEFGIETKNENNTIVVKSWDVTDNKEIDYRLRFEAKYRCEDGHYVRSRMEVIIDNWLFNHNISHAYEKRVLNLNMLCDFYIKHKNGKEYYIEAWGMEDKVYLSRKEEKIQNYNSNKLNLISIDNNTLLNLDDFMQVKFADFL